MFHHPQWFSALLSSTMLVCGLSLKHEDWGGKGQGQKQFSKAE